MNVYFYGLYDNKGGMENYARTLIKGIIEKDSSIHFILIKDCPHIAYEEEFLSLGCSVAPIPPRNKKPFAYKNALLTLFKQAAKENAVVQLNIMSFRNGLLMNAARKSKAKVILVAHGSGIQGTRFKWLHAINRARYNDLGKKVAISKEAAAFVFNSKALIIPNAIDPAPFVFNETKRQAIREQLNIQDNQFLIGQVGRIHPIKNQIFAIKVFERINEKANRYFLCFIGKEQDSSIRKYVEANGLSGKVFILGERDSAAYYSAFDTLLLPSLKEGAGLVLQEGRTNGLHIIASTGVPVAEGVGNIEYLPLETETWVSAIHRTPKRRDDTENLAGQLASFIDTYRNLYNSLIKSISF